MKYPIFPTNCVSLSELNLVLLPETKSLLVIGLDYIVTIGNTRTRVRWDGDKLYYY